MFLDKTELEKFNNRSKIQLKRLVLNKYNLSQTNYLF